MSFVHLHVHSEYSVLDGASKIKELISSAENFGQPALALTDHGNMFGAKEFLDTIGKLKSNVKPILGCEVYVAKGHRTERRGREDQSSYHLLLLAKNIQGYHNLIKLTSYAYIDGFHYKPRIDRELLEKYHEGIICSSACLGGEVPQNILKDNIPAAEETIQWYKSLFGEDYYLEVQRHETDIPGLNNSTYLKQEQVNIVLFELAKKHNIKVIATNDVHFVRKEDGPAHDRLVCVSTNTMYSKEDRLRYTQQEYLKSTEEMSEIFSDHPEVISNTLEIADKVETYTLDSDPILPIFPIPDPFENSDDYLRHQTYKGAKKRYGEELSPETIERIDFELATIKRMGFPDYFLIVQDFILAARDLGVSVGPGRGSAAGSVVAYCLTITDIDPIKYNLLFERFLNPDRISMPDIDIDFDDDGRYKVLKYVEEKYGKDHVSHVVTFGTMGTKSAIKDIARIQDLSLQESDRLSKLVPKKINLKGKEVDPTVALCLEHVQEFKDAYNSGDPILHDTLKYAERLEGTVRNLGVHACAIIIAREDLTNYIPISTAKDKETNEDIYVSQYEGKLIESVGLLKMDFLGLRTLSIIKECVENIKKSIGISIDIDHIPIDDPKTFELFSRGDTVGIFQFESEGMQKWLKELIPSRFEDLIAMNALYRPGPMDYIPDFVARKHGKKKIEYDLAEMEEHLHDTYGVTVYQEQVMLLSQKLANFTKGQADKLRKAMGKKQLEVMKELQAKFFDGGKANGHPEETLAKIWKDWEAFAQYAFNKSHATCYAWVSYQTAYLKAHYPAEFLAANLSKNLNKMDEITKFMDDCKRSNIQVLGPDVNESFTNFTVNKQGNVRFGMAGIKGVGVNAVESILAARSEGPFIDIFDFVERVNIGIINKRVVEALAFSGALDGFTEVNRGTFKEVNDKGETFVETLIKYANSFQNDSFQSENSLFGAELTIETTKPKIPTLREMNQLVLLKEEKELVGMYLSAHPLDRYTFEIEQFSDTKLTDIDDILDKAMTDPSLHNSEILFAGLVTNKEVRLSKNANKPWCKITLEDFSGSRSINLFGKDYETFLAFTNPNESLLIKALISPRYPYVSKDEKNKVDRFKLKPLNYELRLQNMALLANSREKFITELSIAIHLDQIDTKFRKSFTKAISSNKGKVGLSIFITNNDKIEVEFFSRKYRVSITNDLIDYLKANNIRYRIIKKINL